jgi:ribosomal protein S18 acetylase RimI-like enzyme
VTGDNSTYGTLWVHELDKMPLLELTLTELRCRRVRYGEFRVIQTVMEQVGKYMSIEAEMRFSRQREAYVGEVETANGKSAVTYGWGALTREGMGETGWAFEVPPGEAYLYDFATAPQFRGKGYYPELLRFILNDFAKRKIKRAWIATAPGNVVSARSIAKAGFVQVAHTNYTPATFSKNSRFELIGIPEVKPELLALAKKAHIRLK